MFVEIMNFYTVNALFFNFVLKSGNFLINIHFIFLLQPFSY